MTKNPLITINLVVKNGEKYIRYCLDSVLAQTYPHENIEINILDNNSTDSTVNEIDSWKLKIENWKFKFNFVQSKLNLGMWPGQEKLLGHSRGEYVVALSVDIILDKDFIKNSVETLESDERVGALQAKIYKFDLADFESGNRKSENQVIDTVGFQIFRSRRVINTGHGEKDVGQYDRGMEIFGVEGAVPVFRRQAMEDCRLASQGDKIIDHDYFWYGDDLDLAWRMRLFGWKQIYDPKVIAWHDRKTTKSLRKSSGDFISMRRTLPILKRRLDWRNTTLTIIKNDFVSDLFRDLPYILWRQLRLWAYFLVLEPAMIIELGKVAKMMPRMLKRRKEVMSKARITPADMRQWII